METILTMIFTVAGGLGIFLLGMRYMSEGLQTIAGSSLRVVIGKVTNNRLMAVGAGLLVTMMVQSSSITTVMTVGFVNSSIMTLKQAVGVIMGANVGTTITAWILAIKIGKYGLPILGIAAFIFLFSKKEKVKYIAMAVLGIGMVFFGLELMKDGFKPIRSMPGFLEWFQAFSADSYMGVLKSALVGCLLTVVVQSSSATIGITIALASQGIINFETAAALVMGENVGTTITALLASIGTSVNARRTAYFHALFNLLGVFWITAIFSLYLPFVKWVVLTFFGADVNATQTVGGVTTFTHIDFGIAVTHTVFNITNVILFLPIAGYLSDFLERVIVDKDPRKSKLLTHLDFQIGESNFISLTQSQVEIDALSQRTYNLMSDLEKSIDYNIDGKEKDIALKEVFKQEDEIDIIQHEITEFLTDLLTSQCSVAQAEEATVQLRVCDEYESISDYMAQILKFDLRLLEQEQPFDAKQKEEIFTLHKKVNSFFGLVLEFSEDSKNTSKRKRIDQLAEEITDVVRTLRSGHWEKLSETKYSPLVSTCYTDTIHSYRKIKNHLVNIVEALAGEK